MAGLILAEHDNKSLKLSTRVTVAAATQLATENDVLIIGHQCRLVAEDAAKIKGVRRVIVVEDATFSQLLAESACAVMSEYASEYEYFLAPATTFGKNIMPRLAAQLDVAMISDVIRIENGNTFVRPIYAGNALSTVESDDRIKILTVRSTAFNAAPQNEVAVPIESRRFTIPAGSAKWISSELNSSERPDLISARIVVSGGRALQSAENFKLIESLADVLHAAIGASRAAVDAGFVPNDYQVGQTGKIVAPDLYIAIGISGALQHIAGMKDSKIIVAINKDQDAPIFQIATYGLVGDLFDAIPKMILAIQQ